MHFALLGVSVYAVLNHRNNETRLRKIC